MEKMTSIQQDRGCPRIQAINAEVNIYTSSVHFFWLFFAGAVDFVNLVGGVLLHSHVPSVEFFLRLARINS